MQVSLFATCLVDMFYPEVGMDAAEVLARLGCEVVFPEGQTCCGQQSFNAGHAEDARALAVHFLEVFSDSEYIVAPSGSCVGMVRVHYPELFAADPERLALARKLGARTYEFSEFLVDVLKVTDVGAALHAKAAFHASCHLTRELKVVKQPLELLGKVAGLELRPLDRADLCCGFGGTFAVRNAQISAAMADDKLGDAAAQGAEVLVACDMACLMHLGGRNHRQGGKLRLLHLAEVLNRKEGM